MSKLNVDLDVGNVRIVGDSLPEMPWQDKPEGSEAPVWRHTENPVIGRNPVPGIARIFNSAVAPYEGRFVGGVSGGND